MDNTKELNKLIEDIKVYNEALGEKITNEAIAKRLDIGRTYLSSLLSGSKTTLQEHLTKVRAYFPEVFTFSTDPDSITKVNEQAQTYLKRRRDKKNSNNPFLVPFVDIRAQAGYSTAYANIDYIGTLKLYPILPDVDPTGGTWRYFQVDGDSMEPEVRKGDTLLCSLVLKDDWTNIRDMYTYVVVTDEDLLIKDVLKLNDHEWALLSQNPAVEPKKVQVEDVRQLWVVRRHIKNRLEKARRYDIEQIKKQLK